MHLELLTRQVCNLMRSVGGYIRNESINIKNKGFEEKEKNNLVTYVDKESEERLIGGLLKLLPEAGFIAEENQVIERKEEFNWVIDPLDGTTNFVHGIPMYSISVALLENNEVIIGVVYEVNHQECFYTWKNHEAYLNRNIIRISGNNKLDQALLATGFPYYDYSRVNEYMELLKHYIKSTRGVRRMGSAAIDLAYVACGRFDAFFEYGLHPWDVAAGSLLVRNAGGAVSDFSGGENYIFNKQIVASNINVYNQFIEILQKYLNY